MAYLGDLFLFGSAVSALTSLVFYLLAWRGKEQFLNLGRSFFKATAFLVTCALGTLLYLILTHDFTVAYVFSYSSTDLPLGYLIATLWGGQEGTFLLWIFYTVVMGWIMMRTARNFEKGNMFFVNLFLLSLLVILIKKSPFELMPVFKAEGAGLNPLLQNFWMQIHPPIMFVGFAAALFPFCFGMTALVERKYDSWAESARKWTMFGWVTLGTALVMGGYWAYVTLGWGGFWAWDPVENSSFIPWIFLTAQVHVLFIKRQRRGLMRFSLLTVCLSFWSVLYGTFLTRSGVLADFSVHSFVDLGINGFLIGGLYLFVAMGLFFIIFRWRDIRPNASYSKVASRSYLVTLGILILFLGGWLTLIGTSAPLLTRLSDNPSAVGLNYYFVTMTPIAIAVMILLTLFPAFRWNNGVSKPRLLIAGGTAAFLTIGLLLLTGFTYQVIYLLFFGAAAAALVSNGWVVWLSWREGNFRPGYVAHIGLATALIGAGVSAGFETKKTVTLPQGQEIQAMDYTMKFTQMVNNPKGFDCHVEVSADGRQFTAVLPHEFPKNAEGVMRKPHVEKFWTLDVYLAPVAMEQPESNDPGMLSLTKGGSATLDKYTLTFHDYDLTSHDGGGETKAAAVLTVAYDGKTEEIRPSLVVNGDAVANVPAAFDYDRAIAEIAGIQPEQGALLLKVSGSFLPVGDPSTASLVVEVSKKPLINLFWMGTTLCFVSGALSMRERRRRRKSQLVDEEENIPVEPSKEPVL